MLMYVLRFCAMCWVSRVSQTPGRMQTTMTDLVKGCPSGTVYFVL